MLRRLLLIGILGAVTLVIVFIAVKKPFTGLPPLPEVLAEANGRKVTKQELLKAFDELRYFKVRELRCRQIKLVYEDLIDRSVILARYDSLQTFFEREV